MKPAPFEYVAAETVEHALALLDEDVRVLAGGQSLMPLLNLRLARPARLVDVNDVPDLAVLREDGGTLWIGALVRQAALERAGTPLLAAALRHAGDAAVRARGTVGGSVAHADPSAQLPVALAALDARFHLRSAAGERVLGAAELFLGPLQTAIAEDELLTAIEVPPLPHGARTAFAAFAPTRAAFPLAGVAVVHAPGHAAVAILGTGSHPIRAEEAERALLAGAGAREVAESAAGLLERPHRRALVTKLTVDAIEAAA